MLHKNREERTPSLHGVASSEFTKVEIHIIYERYDSRYVLLGTWRQYKTLRKYKKWRQYNTRLEKYWIKQLKFELFGQSKRKTTETNARVHKREFLA